MAGVGARIVLAALVMCVAHPALAQVCGRHQTLAQRASSIDGLIRLGASRQLLQCNIMTACGGGAKAFSIRRQRLTVGVKSGPISDGGSPQNPF